jgi:DNA-binding Lrp family transcriptional regulator
MDKELDDKKKKILMILQEEFPLINRPFQEIAKKIDFNEEEVIFQIQSLVESKMLRKFGAIINPKKIGYVSLLGAIDVAEDKVNKIAEIINEYTGVTHNYLREGHPNIWFTLTEPNKETLDKNLAEIEEKIGEKIIKMPVTKTFKIGVKLAI